MKHGATTWVCAAAAVVLWASAVSADNRYGPIVERNVFGLKPPAPPTDTEASKPPPSNITLTGVITLGGKRALMTTPPPAAKPGTPPATAQSYILREGERQGEIEVISIDEVNFVVKVKNSGQEQTLNFKDNGPKMPAGTPVPPPTPNAPAGMPGQPAFNPGPGTKPMAIPTAAPMPLPNFDRTVRTAAAGNPAGTPNQMNPAALQAGPGVMPGVGAPGATTPNQKWPPEANLSIEEQRAMIELMREKYRQDGNPAANLLPGGGSAAPGNVPPQNPPGR